MGETRPRPEDESNALVSKWKIATTWKIWTSSASPTGYAQLKREVQAGRIAVDQLVDLVVELQQQLQTAKLRIEELEKKATAPPTPTAKVDEPFSMRGEEKRQEARGKKRRKAKPKSRRGRVLTADKIAKAERRQKVYPLGVPEGDCHLSHTRPVWRLENGRAVLVAYEIYRGPGSKYGQIPGVLGRSEFGLEIVTEIAHMVHVVGLSFDKVCQLLHFFQNLHCNGPAKHVVRQAGMQRVSAH